MRLLISSDLHMDHNQGTIELASDGVDVLIIAGDLCQYESLPVNVPPLCAKFPHIIFVAGNHEFYESSFPETRRILRALAAKYPNFHWLDNDTVTIDGQRFVGSTLWYPYTQSALSKSGGFSDFQWIQDLSGRWLNESKAAQKFLKKTVTKDDVVVTHHAPSQESVRPGFRDNPFNCFFYTDMRPLMDKAEPKLWIHGHMHAPADYQFGKTRVLSNPYGYISRGEQYSFNPKLFVEV